MILDEKTLEALRGYSKHIQRPVQFLIYGGEHPKRGELTRLLDDVAGTSPLLSVAHSEGDDAVREGLTFEIVADGQRTGVLFSGIPGGHEFNSLVLATLQAGGHTIKLDESLQRQIRAIRTPISFESIISLECHVCPDVVQLLNQFALLNPLIRHEMIDGALHEGLVRERNVQGVPAVFRDKKPFANGAISAADVLDKLGPVTVAPGGDAPEAAPEESFCDVAVVGGGPAAVAAAIYTARKGLDVILVAGKIGGQLNDTQGIENFISQSTTTGPRLTGGLRQHLAAYPIKVREGVQVQSLDPGNENESKRLLLSTGDKVIARTVIVATGARWRELGVPGEKEYIGRGVAYCPHCDGPFFKGKDVTVVGGGNSGVEAALDLANIAKSVTVLEFMDGLKADQVLIDKLEAAGNTSIHTGVATRSINAASGRVTGMTLVRRSTNEAFEHKTDGVFVQIGLVPNSAFVKDVVETTRYGEVVVDSRCATNIPGIFACGDVTNVPYKQIIIAMGEGAKAGLSAFEYLLKSTASV